MTTWLNVEPRSPRSACAGDRVCASTPSANASTSAREREAWRASSSRPSTSYERVAETTVGSVRETTRTVSMGCARPCAGSARATTTAPSSASGKDEYERAMEGADGSRASLPSLTGDVPARCADSTARLQQQRQGAEQPHDRRGDRRTTARNPARDGEADREQRRDPDREDVDATEEGEQGRRRRVGVEEAADSQRDTPAPIHRARIEHEPLHRYDEPFDDTRQERERGDHRRLAERLLRIDELAAHPQHQARQEDAHRHEDERADLGHRLREATDALHLLLGHLLRLPRERSRHLGVHHVRPHAAV